MRLSISQNWAYELIPADSRFRDVDKLLRKL